MKKYKILKDFSTFEHQYKCGEIYYVDKKIGMDYGMALVYIDNQENSKNIDRINQRYYYCLQHRCVFGSTHTFKNSWCII